MQLFYRGVRIRSISSSLETPLSAIAGRYRGAAFSPYQPHIETPQAAIALTYRGVKHLTARYDISQPCLSESSESSPSNSD